MTAEGRCLSDFQGLIILLSVTIDCVFTSAMRTNDAGEVLGVLDIDSPVSGRFDGDDLDGLEAAAAFLAKKIAG